MSQRIINERLLSKATAKSSSNSLLINIPFLWYPVEQGGRFTIVFPKSTLLYSLKEPNSSLSKKHVATVGLAKQRKGLTISISKK